VIVEVFKPLPSMVVAHYLGVPEADRDRFDRWTDAIVAANANGEKMPSDASAELFGYFTELIRWRRKEPADDTISHLLAAGLATDDSDTAGIISLLGFAFTMVTGGNDTTTGLLGGAVQLLTQRRDQRALLIEDAGRISAAVEEFLRLTSPVQGLCRT